MEYLADMDLYREQLLDHYRSPRNFGLAERFDRQERGHNPLCGDDLTVQLDVDKGMVTAMRFTGHGCAISIAAASLLSEVVVGKTVEEVSQLQRGDVETLLGTTLPPVRLKCGLLALKAVQVGLL